MIPGIEALVYTRKFDRNNFLEFLCRILPRGPIWGIPFPDEYDIVLTGIASDEQFGRITITTGNTVITPDGITTVEAFGNISSVYDIDSWSILSGEGFGTIRIDQQVRVSSIAGAEAFGSPGLFIIPSGAIQQSDFQSGIGTGWNSEFLVDWVQAVENGEGFAKRTLGDGWDKLFPPSGNLSGNWDVYFGMYLASNSGGNPSIHIGFDTAINPNVVDAGWWYDLVHVDEGGNATDPYPQGPVRPGIVHFRMHRVAGVIWVYYWTGSQWKRMDAWSVPASAINNTDVGWLVINGATYNGLAYIYIYGTVV